MKRFKIFVLILVVNCVAQADYTLIHSINTTPKLDLKCELSVLVNFAKAELTIVRLEERGKKMDINAFHKDPKAFENYGRRYPLSHLFSKINLREVKNISAKFDFSEENKKLTVTATSFAGETLDAQKNIDVFLAPAAQSCILKSRGEK